MTVKLEKPRKHPQRSCVACKATSEKQTLLRFVRTAEGGVCFDAGGRLAGRGAYLCLGSQCFETARKKHLLDRALKVKLNEIDYERLAGEFSALGRETDMV